MPNEIIVDKSKFDEVLRKIATTKPVTFREAADRPKAKKGSGIKRSRPNKS